MDLSAKMPATQNSTLPAKMPATITSDAPAYSGEGGSPDASVDPINNQSEQADPEWDNLNDMKTERYWTQDSKTGPSDGYTTTDRKETDLGGLPQRQDFE